MVITAYGRLKIVPILYPLIGYLRPFMSAYDKLYFANHIDFKHLLAVFCILSLSSSPGFHPDNRGSIPLRATFLETGLKPVFIMLFADIRLGPEQA